MGVSLKTQDIECYLNKEKYFKINKIAKTLIIMRVNFFLLLEQSLAEQSKLYPQSYPQFSLLNFVILETFHWLGNFIEPGFHY